MQVNHSTGEVYAGSQAIAAGEAIDLLTTALNPAPVYSVICWEDATGEMRWAREFTNLSAAVAEYNNYAKHKERVPCFN